MYHITVRPDTYKISSKLVDQNPYTDLDDKPNQKTAQKQHKHVTQHLTHNINYVVNAPHTINIPDMTFIASAGLSLPNLPEPIVILPWMKYPQRRKELPYIKDIFKELHVKTVEFPGSSKGPFEGAAEAKWFDNGNLLVMGYGFRSTKETTVIMRKLLAEIYQSYGLPPPKVLAFPLQSFSFYHLDVAMLEIQPLTCIIHKDAIRHKDVQRLQAEAISVHLIETTDTFCLNSIIDGPNLLTHTLADPELKSYLEDLTGKTVVELDTSEFEKSGGSVRCLVFDMFDPRLIKKKQHSHSAPCSPK
jgi:N-dimethylarginine dimethylaminohydrolase